MCRDTLVLMKLELTTICWGQGGCSDVAPVFEVDTDDDCPQGPWPDSASLVGGGHFPEVLPRVCRECGASPLWYELVRLGPDPMTWLVAQEPQVATVYLAARRSGARHDDAVAAATAVLDPPGT